MWLQTTHRRRSRPASSSLLLLAALLGVGLGHLSAARLPSWADPRLPVHENLQAWVDISRQPEAWQAHGKPALLTGTRMDVVYDASGQGRHWLQRNREHQPTFHVAGRHGLLSFDGEGDYLGLGHASVDLSEMSLFLVAVPETNAGGFRAFLSFHETGQNDYRTGFNLDQGPDASVSFEVLNVEGPGFGGFRDLLGRTFPFGQPRRIEAHASPRQRTVQLIVDGEPAGARPWDPEVMRLEGGVLGARYYSNTSEAPAVSGFFQGHVAEMLLYSRRLSGPEAGKVRAYLASKHAPLADGLTATRAGHPLQNVTDPPPVQVLRPGFVVHELPLSLNNINALQYRADGRLFALAYGGPIYVLTDEDGDGLEESAEVFWESASITTPISMALTPPGYGKGEGVFVTTRGKVMLILDTDRDGRGDREEVVATGWRMPDVIGGGGLVEVLGLAVGPDGSVYFGLGCDNYANAYRIHPETGQAAYRLGDERGTIQRVSPDFSSRETLCSGIRYPMGLAFNAAGDLFCTDQEGATWLPNGNPFDELIHIQRGRHYGFPPRHPRHLPDVIDEPSVYNYGPQHQSTCGLTFNEPVGAGPVFGPAWWQGDAFVAGESRGKIYRTQLVKTPAGYVAHNEILACLNHLIIDTAISPAGDLTLTTHGGQPDWGTGPKGKGKLFKIIHADPDIPQPTAAWVQDEGEVRVAFDRPLAAEHLQNLAPRSRIEYGRYVRAGDPFETMRPGYEVVRRQMLEPRFNLDILDVKVTADRRTLVIHTPPQRAALPHALTLPAPARPAKPKASSVPQHSRVDLGFDLNGVRAAWQDKTGAQQWTGWLPHIDSKVAMALTRRSSQHERLWSLASRAGTLLLQGQLDLQDMLRPAIQEGSDLDYEWPPETVFLDFKSSTALTVHEPGPSPVTIERLSPLHSVMRLESGSHPWIPFHLELQTGASTELSVSWHTSEDPRPRALPLHRLHVPWADQDAAPAQASPARQEIPELAGGNWGRGRRIFFNEEALCSKCHQVDGQGVNVGPDLSNLVHRDYASVLRDIREPSSVLNPDHLAFEIALADGDNVTGTVAEPEDGLYLITEGPGVQRRVHKQQVVSMRPLATSLMPAGLDQALGPEQMKDLLTFLLLPPPRMPEYGPLQPPPPRSRTEFQALISGAPDAPSSYRPRHVVLVAGTKDHGPGEHDYPAWQGTWHPLLSAGPNLTVSTASPWPSAEQLAKADALVFYQRGTWNEERKRDLQSFLSRGGGVTYIHWAIEAGSNAVDCARMIGLASDSRHTQYRHGHLDLHFDTASFGEHPILRNFDTLHLHDETYWNLRQHPTSLSVLATAVEEGQPRPQIWVKEQGQGRVFGCIMGHYAWTFDDPLFRVLLLRGIAWSMKEPVDRFNAIASLGVTWDK